MGQLFYHIANSTQNVQNVFTVDPRGRWVCGCHILWSREVGFFALVGGSDLLGAFSGMEWVSYPHLPTIS